MRYAAFMLHELEVGVKIALAFSGGLDTSFCVPYLKETLGAEVITVTVNTGGATRADLDGIAAQSAAVGADGHVEVDAREAVYEGFVATLIRGNVLRGGVYPLSVAAERTQQAMEVARVAREMGADAVAHGSTGAGNDQVRFDIAFRVLLDLPILTPVRELGMTREQSIAYLQERGLPVPGGAQRYSINRGLWGTTLGGGWTHDPWTAPPEDAWGVATGSAAGEGRDIVISWEEGLPAALDGKAMGGVQLVEELGALLEPLGIGRGIHLGETVLGIKGRIGFVAGAPLVLIAAHKELEKLVMTRWQMFWKDQLAAFWGDRLHEGQAFDPVMEDIAAMIRSSQRRVTGDTRVHLAGGRFAVTGVRSLNSLMDPELARYGEENSLWDGAEAAAFAKIAAIPSLLAARHGDGGSR